MLVSERLDGESGAEVYRGLREHDGQSVVLKHVPADHPDPAEGARLRHEHALLSALQLPQVVQSLGCTTQRAGITLTLRAIEGQTLSQWLSVQKPDLQRRLDVTLQLVELLAELHARGVIHRDLSPGNVLVDQTARVHLIDFGNAALLAPDQLDLPAPARLEGTLAYISPEQTGRIDARVDERADLYSFGCLLHQILAGAPPFAGEPEAIVWAHIARRPPSLSESIPTIPAGLAAIADRLLAKNPAERYRGALGVRADLQECRERLRWSTGPHEFVLGLHDVPSRYRGPARLVGREAELRVLDQAYARVRGGSHELVVVVGDAGSGRSALVQSFCHGLAVHGGLVVGGRFEPARRHVPYSALIDVIRAGLRAALALPEARLAVFRAELHDVLAVQANTPNDLFPELRALLGELPSASPTQFVIETRARFNALIAGLVRLLAGAFRNLIVHLDEFQDADPPSLELLRELFATCGDLQILVLAEVRRDHGKSLAPTTEAIARGGARVTHLDLPPLTVPAIAAMLAESCGCTPGEMTSLAAVVARKTAGNPAEVRLFVRGLVHGGVLRLDVRAGRWVFDLDAAERAPVTAGRIDDLLARVAMLDEHTLDLLGLAASSSAPLTLDELAALAGCSHEDTLALLTRAAAQGLVVIDDDVRLMDDRLADAALARLPVERRRHFHEALARRLLARDAAPTGEALHQLAYHCKRAGPRLDAAIARPVFTRAAREARSVAAFGLAVDHLHDALARLPPDPWRDAHDEAFALHLELAECAAVIGEADDARRHFAICEERAADTITRANTLALQTRLALRLGDFKSAVALGLRGLALLGRRFEERPSLAQVLARFAVTRLRIGSRPPTGYFDRPPLVDPRVRCILLLISALRGACFQYDPNLAVLLSLTGVELCAEHGPSEFAPVEYQGYGLLLCSFTADYEGLDRFAGFARELARRFPDRSLEAVLGFQYANHAIPWTRPIRTAIPVFRATHQAAVECGQSVSGALCAIALVGFAWNAGATLEELQVEGRWALGALHRLRQSSTWIERALTSFLDAAGLLMSRGARAPSLSSYRVTTDAAYDDWVMLRTHAFLCLVFRDFDELTRVVDGARASLDRVRLTYSTAEFVVLDALARIGGRDRLHPIRDAALVLKIRRCADRLGRWRRHCDANFGHLQELVLAELARATLDDAAALTHYRAAIDAARRHGFLQWEALALESFGRFLHQREIGEAARVLGEAWTAFERWGALAKADRLQEEFPELGLAGTEARAGGAARGALAIDLTSISRAMTAMSAEPTIDNLLSRLIRLVLESAGADSGWLLLARDGQWFVEAGGLDASDLAVSQSLPLARSPVPEAIVQYALRTREPVVIADVAADGLFAQDRLLLARKPRSILCLPMFDVREGLAGILYLENHLTAGAFTPARLQILRVIASQAVVALELTRLYARLEEHHRSLSANVEARTAELARALESLRAAQRQLVEAEKLASLGSLVAGVTHELGTPLGNAITSTSWFAERAEAIAERLADGALTRGELTRFIEHAQRTAAILQTNLDRADELVRSFREVAVDQSSEMPRTFNMRAYLERVLLSLQPQLKHRPIKLTLAGPGDLELTSYPGALAQIVTNLVSNALVHAFPDDRPGALTLEFRGDGERVILECRDDGVGIAAEHLPRIFDPFFTTRQGRGSTGLGLHLVYNLVTQRLRGEIRCTSAPGAGAVFTVELPQHLEERA